jgi:NADH-quinone oxidoreductase subunit L
MTTVALAVGLPLLSFITSVCVSERYAWTAALFAPLFMLVSVISSIVVFVNVWNHQPFLESATWFTVGDAEFRIGLFLNNTSALMLAVVCVISFLVHVYSIGYMAADEGQKRYFGMLGLFTFSMLGIVLSDNLLIMFIFWELVGFSSYMLIGHWKEKPEAAAAAKKAFILNRVGDAGFLVGLMILYSSGKGFYIPGFLPADATVMNTIAALCLFCGVIGKSAQFPLFTWLPDAMEGPTPVSALIHAATMVAAGVFMLARIFNVFTTDALLVVAIIGIITSLLAGAAALVQHDIKKILAYSTISQLGLMVTAVGVGSWEAAMLHLFTHAFFKASLFLSAGSIIHVLHQAQHQQHVHFDVQDIRNLGGLKAKLPFTFWAVVISGAALAGLPLFSGFISKETILSAIITWSGDAVNAKWIVVGLAFVISFLTVLYMSRFLYKIFLGAESATKDLSIQEAPQIMRAPIALLSLASFWFIVSPNPFASSTWIFPGGNHSITLTAASSFWVLLAAVVGYGMYSRNRWIRSNFISNGFYLDQLFEAVIVLPVSRLANATNSLDRRWIDGALHVLAYVHVTASHLAGWWDRSIVDGSVNGVASLARLTGSLTRSFQSGKIQLYVYWSIVTIIIFLIWSLI